MPTKPPTTTQAAKPAPRSIPTIQREFAEAMRFKTLMEASRDKRLHNLIVERNLADEEAKEASRALAIAMAEDPSTVQIGKALKTVEALKQELAALYRPLMPATHRFEDGAGFQFRPSTKTVIIDEEVLAKDLIDQGLWEAAGASLSVDPVKVSKIIETIALPALSVQQQVTVAAYGPDKEK